VRVSRTEILEQIRRLPDAEKRELVEQLWREFGTGEELTGDLSPEQASELDRRLAEFEANPHGGIPWSEVAERIEKKFGWKLP
jgi:putative addiction module component (TIGR02574 family)